MEKTKVLNTVSVEHAGQFMFPESLSQARAEYTEERISDSELRRVEDDCIRDLVSSQRLVGIKAITDGGLRQRLWPVDFLCGLSGVSAKTVRSGHVFQDVETGVTVPEITGKIEYNPEHPIFADFVFLKSLVAPGETARVALPAPATTLMWVLRNASVQNASETAAQISAAYRATLEHLYGLGCGSVILRDTSWDVFCSVDGLKRLIQGGLDAEQLPELLRGTNDDALSALPAGMQKILFVKTECSDTSAISRQLYSMIIDKILGHGNVDTFMGSEDTILAFIKDASREFPQDKGLIVGVVDPRHPSLENPEEIAARIRGIYEALHPRSIAVSPADGFFRNRDLYDTSVFTERDQWEKLLLLSQVSLS